MQRPAHTHPRPPMTSSEIAMPGEVKADPAALMASLQLLPSPTPNLEIKYTKVKPVPRTLSRSFLRGSFQRPGPGDRLSSPAPPWGPRCGLLKSRPGLGSVSGEPTGPNQKAARGSPAPADGGDDLGTAWGRWDCPGQT